MLRWIKDQLRKRDREEIVNYLLSHGFHESENPCKGYRTFYSEKDEKGDTERVWFNYSFSEPERDTWERNCGWNEPHHPIKTLGDLIRLREKTDYQELFM